MSAPSSVINAFSVDVEDYFQVSAFERHIQRSDWEKLDCRVENNLVRILALLDSHKVKATFFTLGWIAERFPQVIRQIAEQGHEIASHGYAHVRVTQQDRVAFAQDILLTKKILEDVTGCAVSGYRAASYSINRTNLWAHEELQKAGYSYSSSIYPIDHDLYGIPDAPRFAFKPLAGENLVEIPVSTVAIGKRRFPCGGGGFFRLYPYALSRWMIRHINEHERQSALFYFHPWEIDPEQPRVANLPLKTRFRHYLNLDKTYDRLASLLADFRWTTMQEAFFGVQDRTDIPTVYLG